MGIIDTLITLLGLGGRIFVTKAIEGAGSEAGKALTSRIQSLKVSNKKSLDDESGLADGFVGVTVNDEWRARIMGPLSVLIELYGEIDQLADNIYSYKGFFERHHITNEGIVRISENVNHIRRLQDRIYIEFERLLSFDPIVVLLIGKALGTFLLPLDVELIGQSDGQIDQRFMFATYVPRVLSSRYGYIDSAKTSLDQNLEQLRQGIESQQIHLQDICDLRKYERLSHAMIVALTATKALVEAARSSADLPAEALLVLQLVDVTREINRFRQLSRSGDEIGPLYTAKIISGALRAVIFEGHSLTLIEKLARFQTGVPTIKRLLTPTASAEQAAVPKPTLCLYPNCDRPPAEAHVLCDDHRKYSEVRSGLIRAP